jgi:hypothetical protein
MHADEKILRLPCEGNFSLKAGFFLERKNQRTFVTIAVMEAGNSE